MAEIIRAPSDFDDWERLLELLHSAFAAHHGRIDPPSSLYDFDAALIAQKARDEYLFIAAHGDELIGCVFARPEEDSLYVGKIAVRPDCQGRGIARQLMAAAEELARESGLPAIELETRIELIENHLAFSALGFVRTGEFSHEGYLKPTYIKMRKVID